MDIGFCFGISIIMGPTRVLVQDPCPAGSLEILIVAKNRALGSLSQRVHVACQHGSRAQKAVPYMSFGT